MEPSAEKLLKATMQQLHVSGKAFHRVLKRAISDLAECDVIAANPLGEAIRYRPRVGCRTNDQFLLYQITWLCEKKHSTENYTRVFAVVPVRPPQSIIGAERLHCHTWDGNGCFPWSSSSSSSGASCASRHADLSISIVHCHSPNYADYR